MGFAAFGPLDKRGKPKVEREKDPQKVLAGRITLAKLHGNHAMVAEARRDLKRLKAERLMAQAQALLASLEAEDAASDAQT